MTSPTTGWVRSSPTAADARLSRRLLAFAAYVHDEHGFALARAKAHDALRAAEAVAVTGRGRLRAALRAALCASADDAARFDAAFDAFFTAPEGVAQPAHPLRRTTRRAGPAGRAEDAVHPTSSPPRTEGDGEAAERAAARRARFSPSEGSGDAPPLEATAAFAVAADRLVRRVRRGRALRRVPARSGSRIDIRRTLRASLPTGGDPVLVRRMAPPRRNARFVVIVDGSRSMTPHAGAMLLFARALVRRTRRARAFAFSTSVRDITASLRDAAGAPEHLGTAWGGGTRIGSALAAIVAAYGALFTRETMVLIASDGLDVGDGAALDAALRALRARAGAVVWLHPHAGTPGFRPATAALRVALPHLRALVPAANADDFLRLAERIAAPAG